MQRRLLASSFLIFALACTDNAPADGEGSETAADSGDGDGDSGDGDGDGDGDGNTGDGDGDTGVEVVGTIDGVLLDMQMAALPSPLLQFCGPIDDMGVVEQCVGVDEDPMTGDFHIDVHAAGLWSIKVVQGPVDNRNFCGQAFQVPINDGDAVDFSMPPIMVPEVDSLTDLMGETMVDIDGVLGITIDPAMAMSPDFTAPTQLGGILATEFSRVTEIDGKPVIAAWTFSPFGIHSTGAAFEFTVVGNLGLAPNDQVVFHDITKDNGMVNVIATGTVNAMGTGIDVVPTAGLINLTWLMVTQP